MASIVVSPGRVSLDDLAQVLAGAAVVLEPSFWPRVEAASAIVAEAARSNVPVYGINTGFGKLASKRIPPDQTALLQRNLIVSHCCGVGPVHTRTDRASDDRAEDRLAGAWRVGRAPRNHRATAGHAGARRLSAGAAAGIGGSLRRSGAAGAYDGRHDRRGAGAHRRKDCAGPRCACRRRARSDHAWTEGRPRPDQRNAVFDRLCHFRFVARPQSVAHGAGDRRVVGRCGHGFDRAISP